jgi:hypothetical protein
MPTASIRDLRNAQGKSGGMKDASHLDCLEQCQICQTNAAATPITATPRQEIDGSITAPVGENLMDQS